MSDSDTTRLTPGSHRPVFGDLGVRPVPFDRDLDLLASRHLVGIELIGALIEDTVVGVPWGLDAVILASVLPEVTASVTHAALIPSVSRDVDLLVDI